jgi:hypothetical protein
VNPLRNRKGGDGNPPPTAGAPELHPNRIHGSDTEALPTETGSNKLGQTFGTPRQSSTRPASVNGKCSRRRGLNADFVVDRIPEPLLATEITFRCLNADMTEEELNLFKFSACLMNTDGRRYDEGHEVQREPDRTSRTRPSRRPRSLSD